MVLKDCSVNAASTPVTAPSDPFIPTRLTIVVGSVSRIMPPSISSSTATSSVSKLSIRLRLSGVVRRTDVSASTSAPSALTRMSSFSAWWPTTKNQTSALFLYTVTMLSNMMISASLFALVRIVFSLSFFSNACSWTGGGHGVGIIRRQRAGGRQHEVWERVERAGWRTAARRTSANVANSFL
eukprot:scaffold15822_cov108-Isochrysis_galbana.AAC.4